MVRQAIEDEIKENGLKREKLRRRALKYADEIASNISYTNVRFLDILLTWVWNKIYNGTAVHNIEQVKEVGKSIFAERVSGASINAKIRITG